MPNKLLYSFEKYTLSVFRQPHFSRKSMSYLHCYDINIIAFSRKWRCNEAKRNCAIKQQSCLRYYNHQFVSEDPVHVSNHLLGSYDIMPLLTVK